MLIAGMLPLADALNKIGGTQLIVDALLSAMGDASPYMMLSVIFLLTAALGLVLSNTASAVLVARIAIYTAAALGVSPHLFAVAVLIAASAAYSTPVSAPVVTLVVDPRTLQVHRLRQGRVTAFVSDLPGDSAGRAVDLSFLSFLKRTGFKTTNG